MVTSFEIIKHVESRLRTLPIEFYQLIRNNCMTILNKFNNTKNRVCNSNNELHKSYNLTKSFMSEHPELIFTTAHKGNVTVAMDKVAYEFGMKEMLGDDSTYIVVERDPTNKIVTQLHETLVRWKNRSYINDVA